MGVRSAGGQSEARYGPLDEVAWYDENSGGDLHEVAQKRANAFGLFDMLGNMWEWVSDWYGDDYYGSSPSTDPVGPSGGDERVLRSGSWSDVDEDYPLLEKQVVDSLGMITLISLLEEEFGVEIDDGDVVPSNFRTIADIAALVDSKRG